MQLGMASYRSKAREWGERAGGERAGGSPSTQCTSERRGGGACASQGVETKPATGYGLGLTERDGRDRDARARPDHT